MIVLKRIEDKVDAFTDGTQAVHRQPFEVKGRLGRFTRPWAWAALLYKEAMRNSGNYILKLSLTSDTNPLTTNQNH